MIPELQNYTDEIERIFEMSKEWLKQHGRHAVLLIDLNGDLECAPFPLTIVKAESKFSNSEFQKLVEKYNTEQQIVVYGNNSNQFCSLTLLEGKNLERAHDFLNRR